jgi:MFS superfamily sulfate permease-like transporter
MLDTASLITAVAFIITTNLQEGIAHGVASSVTELLKHSIAMITADIQVNFTQHVSKLAETAQAQATIVQDMQKTQEDMAESAWQAATQV